MTLAHVPWDTLGVVLGIVFCAAFIGFAAWLIFLLLDTRPR